MAIVGTLPYTISAGQLVASIPVMGDYNFIAAQVNANAAPLASPAFTGPVTMAGSLTVSGGATFNSLITASGGISGTLTGTASALVSSGNYQLAQLGVGAAPVGPNGYITSSIGGTTMLGAPTVQVFNTNGTFTYTAPAGLRFAKITCTGAGGASGGAAATGAGQGSAGGGGGGGGTIIFWQTAAQIGATKTVIVGKGGTGVSGATGNSGTASKFGPSFGGNGGGGGGVAAASASVSTNNGGQGGDYTIGTGTFVNFGGFNGNGAIVNFTNGWLQAGYGGASYWGAKGGFGFSPAIWSNSTGSSFCIQGGGSGFQNVPGAGGAGVINTASLAAQAGNPGNDGIVIVEEYY
jgi:hypothetical protein